MTKTLIPAAVAVAAFAIGTGPAAAQDGFTGELRIFPYAFCPQDYAPLDGATQSIGTNPAMFALIGTAYGGNGQTTFRLPDARGRVLVDDGIYPPTLTTYPRGAFGGLEDVAGVVDHSHVVRATTDIGDTGDPNGAAIAEVSIASAFGSAVTVDGTLAGTPLASPPGAPQSVANLQPSSVVQRCIATDGRFPSRN